jgi:hypothetical protein
MKWIRLELNEFMHIKHNNSDQVRMKFNVSEGAVVKAAFQYDQKIDYCADTSVKIGEMAIICQYCKALKYSGESTGLCCAGGKVNFHDWPHHQIHYGH